MKSWRFLAGVAVVLAGTFSIKAQTPPSSATRLTATTQSVSGAGEAIKITINNWSTDAQRDAMVAAWTGVSAAPEGRGARGGGGGGRGRGAAAPAPADVPADPDAVDPDSPAARFGRGGARGGANETPAANPEAALAAALKKAPTIGTIWTSETVGYSIKYAFREQRPEGGERIILATDRRVGAWSNLWKPSVTTPATEYPFSIIEFRLNAAGDGEGRGVLFGKVAVDAQAKSVALDNYSTLPVVFKGVKKR